MNITSPVKNNPPGIPFSAKNVERLGVSATGAMKIQETCLVGLVIHIHSIILLEYKMEKIWISILGWEREKIT